MDPQLVCNEISGAGFESLIHDYEQVAEGELCRIGALKPTCPAVVQSELPETGGRGRGATVCLVRPSADPRAYPLSPRDSNNIETDSTNYHSLKRLFEQLAASVVSCGYFWVLASRGGWAGLSALAMRSASWETCQGLRIFA
jgi:hypothetical protein